MQNGLEAGAGAGDGAPGDVVAGVGLDVEAVHAPVLEGPGHEQELGGRVDRRAAGGGGQPRGADLDGEEPARDAAENDRKKKIGRAHV